MMAGRIRSVAANWLYAAIMLSLSVPIGRAMTSPGSAMDITISKKLPPQQAYSRLMKIGYFALGGVGYEGSLSEGEIYLRIILNDKSAYHYFNLLAKDGGYPAKLYALCGMRKTDKNTFQNWSASLRKISAPISVYYGCKVVTEDFSKIISDIANGEYDGILSNEEDPDLDFLKKY